MTVKYFPETDTAFIKFDDNKASETKDINENIIFDLNEGGNLVSMTIEHANKQANLSEFSIQ